jgi:Ser/Thr protein kinase RdoA (MazF antagonist)
MSSIFPTTYSTLSSLALASLISEKYGLENIQCQFMVRGVGDTYSVESPKNRFILRVYRSSHRSLPQIKAETELLVALKQANVQVSYPIPDFSGEMIQTLEAAEGKRYAVLFSYAPGRTVSTLNENQLRNLGHEMARFHNVSSTIGLSDKRWNLDLEATLFQPLEMVKPAFAEIPEDYAWWQQAAEKIEKKLAQLDTSEFSIGYCHYDFLPKNFHFEGDSITFFDFDFLGYGWLVNDIMTFWLHLSLDTHFGRMSRDAADQAYALFLAAYREYRPLSAQEVAAVPYLFPGFLFYGTAFHMTHDQFYHLVQPSHLKLRTALVRQLTERYWD